MFNSKATVVILLVILMAACGYAGYLAGDTIRHVTSARAPANATSAASPEELAKISCYTIEHAGSTHYFTDVEYLHAAPGGPILGLRIRNAMDDHGWTQLLGAQISTIRPTPCLESCIPEAQCQ